MKNNMPEIINLCISIDKIASDIYLFFSSNFENPDTKIFWEKISNEEKEHIQYWEKLLEMTNSGIIPQLFDNQPQIQSELEDLLVTVKKLKNDINKSGTITDAFLAGFRMEFYLMHPAFASLFHYLSTINSDQPTPDQKYENHLIDFIKGMGKYSIVTPEFEMLSDSLIRIWKENRKLNVLSSTDSLTGVSNRRGFYIAANSIANLAYRNKFNIGILFIDIDNFKNINDTLGHQKGDEELKIITNIIKENIRQSDILSRYGGDEFLVFFSNVNADYLYGVAEKIRMIIAEKTKDSIPLTVSIGAAQGLIENKPEERIDELISLADKYMYEAKSFGKNRVCMDYLG